jgi:hypothetical protein
MRMARRALVLLAVLMLAAIWPAGGGTTADQTPALPFYGIQFRDILSQRDLLAPAGDAGAELIRVNLRWAEVEPTNTNPPTYVWDKYDALFGAMAQAGFAIMVTVRDNPSWAATTPCGPIDKVPAGRLVSFLQAAVARYSGAPYHIKYWELYNEPDNQRPDMHQQGGCWGQYPAQYAALLGQVYPAVKAVDPQAQVVFGGLALELLEDYFNHMFLNQVLASPGGKQFDVMNFHYYRAFHWRWDPFGKDLIGKTAYVRGVMAQAGLQKPIILTEVGYPSAGPAEDGQDYSEEASSRYLMQAHARAHAAGLRAVVWFEMMDDPDDPRKYGLLRADGSAKPSYTAYQTFTRELAGLPYLRDASQGTLEAYAFDAGDREKLVCWSETVTQTMSLPAIGVWIVDKAGRRSGVLDGSPEDLDGRRDGVTSFPVGPEPRIVYPLVRSELPRPAAYLPRMSRGAR